MFYLYSYRVYQGIRINLGKRSSIIIFDSLVTTFEVSCIFWGNFSAVAKIGLKSNRQIKPNLSKSLIHMVTKHLRDKILSESGQMRRKNATKNYLINIPSLGGISFVSLTSLSLFLKSRGSQPGCPEKAFGVLPNCSITKYCK